MISYKAHAKGPNESIFVSSISLKALFIWYGIKVSNEYKNNIPLQIFENGFNSSSSLITSSFKMSNYMHSNIYFHAYLWNFIAYSTYYSFSYNFLQFLNLYSVSYIIPSKIYFYEGRLKSFLLKNEFCKNFVLFEIKSIDKLVWILF